MKKPKNRINYFFTIIINISATNLKTNFNKELFIFRKDLKILLLM